MKLRCNPAAGWRRTWGLHCEVKKISGSETWAVRLNSAGTCLQKQGSLTTRARMTQVSEAGDMIIEHFDFQVLQSGKMIYQGQTHFGFFTPKALADQVGLQQIDMSRYAIPDGFGHRQTDRDAES